MADDKASAPVALKRNLGFIHSIMCHVLVLAEFLPLHTVKKSLTCEETEW